ncbi:MAG: site-2 protease family protein [Pirellulales bacterium]|nr:site-2 protease family protein [Pirellulales bacterium]
MGARGGAPLLETLVGLLTFCGNILLVALGVGFVIFVHELGHFVVAKLCGVKCEKFYLGFDIGGWSLLKFRRGETQYGIGILPLGGYVKMLGQVDNPAQLRAEIERAKLQQPAADAPAAPEGESGAEGDSPIFASQKTGQSPESGQSPASADLAAAEQALYDPRSYLAKNVPQRMAIIAAGVTMNVIFAFFMAVWAYGLGVEKEPCAVGEVIAGEAGWQVGLRPGDRIVEIAGRKVEYFNQMQIDVTVSDHKQGVPVLVQRPGEKQLLSMVLHPRRREEIPRIGVLSLPTTTIAPVQKTIFSGPIPPYAPYSAAAEAKPPLESGQRIVEVNGKPVADYVQLLDRLVEEPADKPLSLGIETIIPAEDGQSKTIKVISSVVPPQPVRTLGLEMTMGAITAVQNNSPAAEAGIRPGDKILKIDGDPPGDPMQLPDWFRRRAGQKEVRLTLERKGSSEPLEIVVPLRRANWFEDLIMRKQPMSIPQLGLTYAVLDRVDRVTPGSAAEKKPIKPGAVLVKATIPPPTPGQLGGKKITIDEKFYDTYEFGEADEALHWPMFFKILQLVHPQSTVELTFKDGTSVKLPLTESKDWFEPERGWLLTAETKLCKAESLGDAIRLGAEDTGNALLLVVKILRGLGTRQISPKALGGPGTIFAMAYQTVQHGLPRFLLFLTLLSANLAVLNLLPIPVLDGGHLVFLAYEGVRGKPANERVQVVLSIIGFFLLLALMLFVITLDIWRFLL